jgi:hypothetical protein
MNLAISGHYGALQRNPFWIFIYPFWIFSRYDADVVLSNNQGAPQWPSPASPDRSAFHPMWMQRLSVVESSLARHRPRS